MGEAEDERKRLVPAHARVSAEWGAQRGSAGEGLGVAPQNLPGAPTGHEVYIQTPPDALGSDRDGISWCWLQSKLSLGAKAANRPASPGITPEWQPDHRGPHSTKRQECEHALSAELSSCSQQSKR